MSLHLLIIMIDMQVAHTVLDGLILTISVHPTIISPQMFLSSKQQVQSTSRGGSADYNREQSGSGVAMIPRTPTAGPPPAQQYTADSWLA